MKLFKPEWVSQADKHKYPMYSVDVHPDGLRFATGGQENISNGSLIIWNMSPLVNTVDEDDESVARILCNLKNNHTSCVNCVRWSHSGKYLASAGEDRLIMIWEETEDGRKPEDIEHWGQIVTLGEHKGPILDLAWSPGDEFLASCSVDNFIVIWNAQEWPRVITTLEGHTSHIKGLVWDPLGEFLASQSEDKTLRVWRKSDWKEETSITKPFVLGAGDTMFLRPGWSPDGQHLVTTHAYKSAKPSAKIIHRSFWNSGKDLIGHAKSIACVSFNPHMFTKPGDQTPYSCFAIGDKGGSLSVWVMGRPMPLAVISDLFMSTIMDLSWNAIGTQLLACSYDGTVAVITFSDGELGTPVNSVNYQTAVRSQKYVRFAAVQPVVEPTLQSWTSNSIQATKFDSNNNEESLLKNKQIEKLLPGGMKRITPFLASSSKKALSEKPKLGLNDASKGSPMVLGRETNPVATEFEPMMTYHVPADGDISEEDSELEPRNIYPNPIQLEQKDISKMNKSIVKNNSRNLCAKNPPKPAKTNTESVAKKIQTSSLAKRYPMHDRNLNLEVENNIETGSEHQVHFLRCRENTTSQILWQAIFDSKIEDIATSESLIVVLTDGASSLSVFSSKGARILPKMSLESPAYKMGCHKHFVVIITHAQVLTIWDFQQRAILLELKSLLAIVKPTLACVSEVKLTDNGRPVVCLQSGKSHMFDPRLNIWLELTNEDNAVVQNCETLSPGPKDLPLATLQKTPLQSNPQQVKDEIRIFSTIAYIESQLLASEAMESAEEFRYWLLSLVRFTVKEGIEDRLRNLCDNILNIGQPTPPANLDKLGIDRRKLLKEILTISKTNPKTQHLGKRYEPFLM